MNKTCRHCSTVFQVTDKDLAFYSKISPVFNGKKFDVPSPTHCPDCRQQKRLTFRNERHLYKRKCDMCKKEILSAYPSGKVFPVFCLDCWWSDNWNAYDFGMDFDFDKPFFEQFKELQNVIPRRCLDVVHGTMENSDFCNQDGHLKNCYLIFNSDYSEQCYYGKGINFCFNCLDSFKINDCEKCYECSNCKNCSFSTYLNDSYSCDDCHFSTDLIGCSSCFGCDNLRNQKYCFYNEKLSKEDYETRISEIKSKKTNEKIWIEFLDKNKDKIMRHIQSKNIQDCTGEYLINCKSCYNCYDCESLEDSKYCTDLKRREKMSANNYDISFFGAGVDFSYESTVTGLNTNQVLFTSHVWENCVNVYYCENCVHSSHDLFGCNGLRHGEYCVLNKKYSKKDYEMLVAKIIEHMINTGEWGEFFPISVSPHGYNETVAQEYYPITKEEAVKEKWPWHDEKPLKLEGTKTIKASDLPYNIKEIGDEVLDYIFECEESGKPFKLQKQELKFYREMNLPLPKYHPDVRHRNRFDHRRPRKLWKRKCKKCGVEIETTISSEISEKVYCEKCYLETVY